MSGLLVGLLVGDASESVASVSDTAYDATSWNGVTDVAPSKNAVRDKFESLSSGPTFGALGRTGSYYMPLGAAATAANYSRNAGVMDVSPLWIGRAFSIDRIGCEIGVLGASSVVRLGIYQADAAGFPGDLLLDAGTVDASTTGVKEITISQALTAGLYWLAAAVQVATCQPKCMPGSSLDDGYFPLTTAPAASDDSGFTISGVTGALPASYGSTLTRTSAIRVFVRAA